MTANEFRKMNLKKHSKKGLSANKLTNSVLDYLNSTGFMAWRNNTMGVYDAKKQCYRRFNGLRGVGDILGIHKATGTFLSVEIKAGKDKLSVYQKKFIEDIEKYNGLACEVRQISDLIEYLDENIN